jgi:hypothetical protein
VTRLKQLRTGKPVFDAEFVLLNQQREMNIQKQEMKMLKAKIDIQGEKMDTQAAKMDEVLSILGRLANKVVFASDVGRLEGELPVLNDDDGECIHLRCNSTCLPFHLFGSAVAFFR